MQRWKANICFHSHLSKTIFTNLIQPISPSSTAFNQCIKIVRLRHICPLKSLFERKHCFPSSLKILVQTLFSKHQSVSDSSAAVQIQMEMLSDKHTAFYKVWKWRLLPHFTAVKMSQLNYESNLSLRSCDFSPQCVVKRLLVIHLVRQFSMKWCVQSQLNLRQSLRNYSSSRPLLELLVLGVLCDTE